MKYLPLKLGIFVVLLFTLVIAACFLWKHLRIRHYVSLFRSDEIQERIKGFDELLSMEDKGEKVLVSAFPDGEDAARLLIDNWQDVDKVINMDNCTCAPINHAARKSWWDTTLLFIGKGAEVNGKDKKEGCTPLHRAAASGRKDVVNALLAHGADLHIAMSPKGDHSPSKTCWTIVLVSQPGAFFMAAAKATPLHCAAATGQKDIAALLIEKGADISAKDVNGHTPLYYAAIRGKVRLVDYLISRGANINDKDMMGRTPLHMTLSVLTSYGYKEVADLLVAEGAEVNARDRRGETPLHDASSLSDDNWLTDAVELLIEKGADVNAEDKDGDSPLHNAAQFGALETIRLLIENGSDVNAINHESKTPLDCTGGFTSVKEKAALLRAHGGMTGKEIREQENRIIWEK